MPHVAEKYMASPQTFDVTADNDKWPHEHITELCEKLDKFESDCIDEVNFEYLRSTLGLSMEEIYEIGATALDASIMLTFRKFGDQVSNSNG